MFAASDPLITVIVLLAFGAIGAISNWLQKRRQSRDEPGADGEGSPPRPLPPGERRPQSPASSWEDELRRLLQGEAAPAPKPPVVRPPPPLVRPPPPLVRPPPIPQPARPRQAVPARRTAPRPAAAMPHRAGSTEAAESARHLDRKVEEHLRSHVETLPSAGEHPRTVSPGVAATDRLRSAAGAVGSAKVSRGAAKSPEVAQVKSMLKEKHSARAAILASVILGSPKALEN
jgi:hypothetical protein